MAHTIALLLCIIAFAVSCFAQFNPAPVGTVVFRKDFGDGSLAGWSGTSGASIVTNGYNGKKAVKITATSRTAASLLKTEIDATKIVSSTVRVSATLRADGVSVPAATYNGVKVMLTLTYYNGTKTYPQKTRIWGTFGWNATIANNDVVIPSDVQSIVVNLGLQDSTGTVYFDSVSLTTISSPARITQAEIAALTVNCEFTGGPGVIKPFISCQVGNAPAGKTFPDTFQIRIGATGGNPPAGNCDVSYITGSPADAFCTVATPIVNGNYVVYARLSNTTAWAATSSSASVNWPYPDNYIGCYVDSTTTRDLTTQGPSSTTKQSVERCNYWCGERNFQYAGVQNGVQCFCGNQYGRRGVGKVDDNQCNKTCSGDNRSLCGGASRNSIYYAPTRSDLGYYGCFVDGTPRDLPNQVTPAGSVTVDTCRVACYNAGYSYAGLQGGNKCFCGNSYDTYGSAPESDCSTNCAGDATVKCGGTNRNSVWEATWFYQDLAY